MGTPKTANVATAIAKYSDLDLSCQHITTGNFMEFNVAKCMPLVPRQTIDIDKTTFTRLEPLSVPTFGNADIHDRAFFVPFRTIMRGWNEFITDTPYIDGTGSNVIINNAHMIKNRVICQALRQQFFSEQVSNPDEDNKYDFISRHSGSTTYWRFTPAGKHIYKLLCSLGYRIYLPDNAPDMEHSALPLLAALRVYYDWYYPSAYVDDERAQSLQRWFSYDMYIAQPFSEAFTSSDCFQLFREINRVAYDSDYFVSAWDNPVAPNDSAFTGITFKDVTLEGSPTAIITEANGTSALTTTQRAISQFALTALKSVNDYLKRHQIAGARVLDRYLSRFGIQLESAKLNRSVWIGDKSSKIQFGDVTSTADTDGSPLGGYAGKGYGLNQSDGYIHYTADEYGLLIMITTIVPKTAYYQGADRYTFHSSRFDFFTPEFDNLGVQALATRELFVPTYKLNGTDLTSGIDFNKAVFGFVPRYAEYKRAYDNLTGDYVLPSKSVGKEGWTLMRDVSHYYNDASPSGQIEPLYDSIVHAQSFVDGDDAEQYNRIFDITDNVEDKFNIIHNFVVKTRFPGRKLYDSYEFNDDDKAQHVNIDVNGVRAN